VGVKKKQSWVEPARATKQLRVRTLDDVHFPLGTPLGRIGVSPGSDKAGGWDDGHEKMVEGGHDAEAEEAYTRGLRLLESLITGHKRKVRGYRSSYACLALGDLSRSSSYHVPRRQGTHRFATAHLTENKHTHTRTHAHTHHVVCIRMARNGNTPFR